jgi:hypothetical protein
MNTRDPLPSRLAECSERREIRSVSHRLEVEALCIPCDEGETR